MRLYINDIHPAISAVPPIGVMAPNQRKPVKGMRYRVPEKIRIPATNNPKVRLVIVILGFIAISPSSIKANA
jgi:hypothetical protein